MIFHVLIGSLFLLLWFLNYLRKKDRTHQKIGKLALIIGFITCLSALAITLLKSHNYAFLAISIMTIYHIIKVFFVFHSGYLVNEIFHSKRLYLAVFSFFLIINILLIPSGYIIGMENLYNGISQILYAFFSFLGLFRDLNIGFKKKQLKVIKFWHVYSNFMVLISFASVFIQALFLVGVDLQLARMLMLIPSIVLYPILIRRFFRARYL